MCPFEYRTVSKLAFCKDNLITLEMLYIHGQRDFPEVQYKVNDSEDKERKLSFKCCIPRDKSSCTDDELRLSIVSLKNALINITVCMTQLERELKKRGATTSVLKSMRDEPSSELLEIATIRS